MEFNTFSVNYPTSASFQNFGIIIQSDERIDFVDARSFHFGLHSIINQLFSVNGLFCGSLPFIVLYEITGFIYFFVFTLVLSLFKIDNQNIWGDIP